MRAKYALLGVTALAALLTAAYSSGALATVCPATSTTTATCTTNGQLISILIDNTPTTTISNLVDNSVTVQQTSSQAGGSLINIIENAPITTIYNLVENTINLSINDPVGIPIAIFIQNTPTTIIYNIVDNSISVSSPGGSPGAALSSLIESIPMTSIFNLVDNSVNVILASAELAADVAFSDPPAVPEPTALSLLAIGLGAVGLFRIKHCNR
jgi:hypothetical protein